VSTTTETPELVQVVTDWRGEAAVLRRRGDARAATLLEQCADEVSAVSDEYTLWLSEDAAARRSGWTLTKVRRHALAFLHTPHVVMEKRVYRLRACIVPRRAHLEMIRAAAQQGAA
jgi:hypothetical protein